MNLIFISSYMNVIKVINIIEKENNDFIIITSDKKLNVFFSDFYSPDKVIKIPLLFNHFRSVYRLLKDCISLPFYKKKFIRVFLQKKPKKIFFFFIGYNFFETWLINKLSINVKVYYDPEVDINQYKDVKSFKLSIKVFFLNLFLGIKFKISSFAGNKCVSIDKCFLNKVRANSLNLEKSNMDKHIRKFKKFRNIKVLLLVGGEYNLDRNLYDRKIHEIYQTIAKTYHPKEIGIKSHPGFPNIELSWKNNSIIIPDVIPSSILCYMAQVIIDYGGATLFEANKLEKTAISFVNLIPSTNINQAQEVKKYLLDNTPSGNIDFPETLDDLDILISKKTKNLKKKY